MTVFAARGRISLERQLQFAYIAAFTVVIAAFAFASRTSFEQSLQEQTLSRLVTLARAGTASVAFTKRGFVVDAESFGGFTSIDKEEGLEWFDINKNLVAERGLTAPGTRPEPGPAVIGNGTASLQTYTTALRTSDGSLRGYVRALESSAVLDRSEHPLDLALLFGGLIATIAAAAGGTLLARAAVARTEQTLKRLTDFTADAAHELRGPLTALATTTSAALRESTALPEVTRTRLSSILELGNGMRRLVDDLLVLARAGQPLERDIFVIDIPSVVSRVRDRFSGAAEEKALRLELACQGSIQMYGNEDQIERIVANLVDNAIRYTPRRGRVRVECGEDAGSVFVSVGDSGPGIAPQHHAKVFERFWRADEARSPQGGSGLGLAIAQALARRHGGDINLESDPPNGSTFTLRLPRN